MVCYDRLFLTDVESGVSILFGNGVKLEFGENALKLGSVRILEHRVGHWSVSMKSFAWESSHTSNPLSCGCERHIGCVQPFCGLIVMRSSVFHDARLRDCLWSILLHCITYIKKCLVSSSFGYNFLLVFIARAFILVQLF